MKKHYSAVLFSAMALSVFSFVAVAEENMHENREAVHECMKEAGIERPARGERLSEEDRVIADKCFTDNGLEPPRKRFQEEE